MKYAVIERRGSSEQVHTVFVFQHKRDADAMQRVCQRNADSGVTYEVREVKR